jgi:hypothetical protein
MVRVLQFIIIFCLAGAGGYYYYINYYKKDFPSEVQAYQVGQAQVIPQFHRRSLEYFEKVDNNLVPSLSEALREKFILVAKDKRSQNSLTRDQYSEVLEEILSSCYSGKDSNYDCLKNLINDIREHGSEKRLVNWVVSNDVLTGFKEGLNNYAIEVRVLRSCYLVGSIECVKVILDKFKDRKGDDYITLLSSIAFLVLDGSGSSSLAYLSQSQTMSAYESYVTALVFRYLYQPEKCLAYSQFAINPANLKSAKPVSIYHMLFNHTICLRRNGRYQEAKASLEKSNQYLEAAASVNYNIRVLHYIESSLISLALSMPVRASNIKEELLNKENLFYYTSFKNYSVNPSDKSTLQFAYSELPKFANKSSMLSIRFTNLYRDIEAITK